MKKLLLSASLFVCASNIIAAGYGSSWRSPFTSQPSYEITKSVEVKMVGVGQHDASMFSLMTGTVANQDCYIQIPCEIAQTVPGLNMTQKKIVLGASTPQNLKILVDYMRIRRDIEEISQKDGQTFNERSGISNNAFRAKQGMVDFVQKISVEIPQQKDWLKNTVKRLYNEQHSIGLLDLPVTQLLQLGKDQGDKAKVSVLFNGNLFFQIPLQQANDMFPDKQLTADSIIEYNETISEQTIVDIANFWALTFINSGHQNSDVWNALWEELPNERQKDVNENDRNMQNSSNWSVKFPPTLYSKAKHELKVFFVHLYRGNGRGMFSVIKRNGKVLLGTTVILAAAVFVIYKKR